MLTFEQLKKWIDTHVWTREQVAGWATSQFWRRAIFRQTSDGAVHAGLPVALDAAGKLDSTFYDSADVVLLTGAQNVGGVKTFDDGIKFAHETLNYYDEGVWTPEVADATTAGNVASTAVAYGQYIRIGKLVHADCRITSINTAGMTAGNAFFVRGLPFAMAANTNYRATGSVVLSSIAFTGFVSLNTSPSGTWVKFPANTTGATVADLLVSAITSGSGLIHLSIDYIAA